VKNNIDIHLDAFEAIALQLDNALTCMDAEMVEKLVIEQCKWMNAVPKNEISVTQVARLSQIGVHVLRQQALIEQALRVTEYFLSRLHESPTITVAG